MADPLLWFHIGLGAATLLVAVCGPWLVIQALGIGPPHKRSSQLQDVQKALSKYEDHCQSAPPLTLSDARQPEYRGAKINIVIHLCSYVAQVITIAVLAFTILATYFVARPSVQNCLIALAGLLFLILVVAVGVPFFKGSKWFMPWQAYADPNPELPNWLQRRTWVRKLMPPIAAPITACRIILAVVIIAVVILAAILLESHESKANKPPANDRSSHDTDADT